MYALVADRDNGVIWRSPSLVIADPGLDLQISAHGLQIRRSDAGVFAFDAIRGTVDLYCLSNEIFWEGLKTPEVIFNVCVDQQPYQTSIDNFRIGLVSSFCVLLLLLSLVLVLALRWGMRPLRQIQDQLQELEQGDRRQLEEVQPRELVGLVASLNRFVTFEAAQRKHHRQALDDLAHSLKTPLSVLGLGISRESPDVPLLQDQVSRMQGIVDHQLSRVARIAQTESAMDRPWVSVGPVIQRLIRALSVGYAENEFDFPAHEDMALRIHEDDLLDILGNVLENACKHGARRVRVTISDSAGGDAAASKQAEGAGLVLCVEDDGPGIEQSQVVSVLSRGARLDSQVPGQGIGLAMVVELLSAYEGSMDILPSALGGVAVRLHFPQARPVKVIRS
jgi:two-component system sensor histidine kinase PhoQ